MASIASRSVFGCSTRTVQTDWFLLGLAEVRNLAVHADPLEAWPSLSLKDLTESHLLQLWRVLPYSLLGNLRSINGDLLYQGSIEGPFIFQVHPAFIQQLALLDPLYWPTVAYLWQQTGQLGDWECQELVDVLLEIQPFARRALREDKPILHLAND